MPKTTECLICGREIPKQEDNPAKDIVLRQVVESIEKKYPMWFQDWVSIDTEKKTFVYKGEEVAVNTRALNYEYTLEYAQDMKVLGKREELFQEIIDSLGTELNAFCESMKNQGKKVVFFEVLQVMTAVRPDRFVPLIGFKTRYALVDLEKKNG